MTIARTYVDTPVLMTLVIPSKPKVSDLFGSYR